MWGIVGTTVRAESAPTPVPTQPSTDVPASGDITDPMPATPGASDLTPPPATSEVTPPTPPLGEAPGVPEPGEDGTSTPVTPEPIGGGEMGEGDTPGPVEGDSTDEDMAPSPSPETEGTDSEGTPETEEADPGETPDSSSTESPDDMSSTKTVVDMASTSESFSTLTAAIEAAGLKETLSGDGPFTVFAPTNEAFAALPPGVLDALLKPENKEVLVKLLTYHVLPTEVASSDLATGDVNTVEGSTAQVSVADEGVKINDANVVQPDISASNGVIHSVDKVLVPAGLQ